LNDLAHENSSEKWTKIWQCIGCRMNGRISARNNLWGGTKKTFFITRSEDSVRFFWNQTCNFQNSFAKHLIMVKCNYNQWSNLNFKVLFRQRFELSLNILYRPY
jgi:hypothetical protein